MSALQLKCVIVLLLLLMVLSLFNGLYILFQDQGAPESKRTFHQLVIRVSLASMLLTAMIYGFATGKLHSSAPWNNPAVKTQPVPENTGRN